MKVSFLGKHSIYKIEQGNKTLYTVTDSNDKIKKTIRHTLENNGARKREILSPDGDLVELTLYNNAHGLDYSITYDSKGHMKRNSISENNPFGKNYIITEFFNGGEVISRMLSIEKKPNLTEVSEILYDQSGKITGTNYMMLSKEIKP